MALLLDRREGLKEAETPESRLVAEEDEAEEGEKERDCWRGGIYTSRESAARGGIGPRARRARGGVREPARWRTGAGDENAKRRRGPRSIPERRRKRFHFVFRTSPRVARSFFQDGRVARARRCITSVTRAPREGRQLPCRSGKECDQHPPLRGASVVLSLRGCSETSILVREASEMLRCRKPRSTFKTNIFFFYFNLYHYNAYNSIQFKL